MLKELESIGLKKEEANIYLSSLQVGTNTIGVISKQAGVKRQTCLYTIKKLIDLGYLTSFTKNNIVYYTPESPEIIIKKAKERLENAEKILPELLSITNTINSKPKIYFYQNDFIDSALKEVFLGNETICVFANLDYAIKNREKELIDFRKKRENIGRKTKIITSFSKEVINFLKVNGIPYGDEYRFIEKDDFYIENDIQILKDSVIILSLPVNEKYAIVINSISYANTQQKLFDLLWEKGKTLDEICKIL